MRRFITMRQCVSCGFNASRGERIEGKFVCAACLTENLDEEETRIEAEDWAEVNRLSYQYYTVLE